jgi:hypothetical protein
MKNTQKPKSTTVSVGAGVKIVGGRPNDRQKPKPKK